jgi:hypothetical protein
MQRVNSKFAKTPVLSLDETAIKPDVDVNLKSVEMSRDEMKLFSRDIQKISNSKSTKEVLSQLKCDNERSKFLKRIESVLEKLDIITLKTDNAKIQKMMLFVMQSANDLLGSIHDKDCETYKLCLTLLKRFFNDDEELTAQVMTIVLPQIKKLTIWRRYKHTVIRTITVFFSVICQKM